MLTQNTYTIPEMARMINKTSNTCYRYVREKKLNVITVKQHGKNIVIVTDEELKRFCKENDIIIKQHGNNVITENNNVVTQDIQDIIKSSIKDSIDVITFQLTKPFKKKIRPYGL